MIAWQPQRRMLFTAALAIGAAAAIGMLAVRGIPGITGGWMSAPRPIVDAPPALTSEPAAEAAAAAGPIQLTDVTSLTGIRFRHQDGGSGELNLIEAMTGGLALFDYDGDGLIDIYFVSGRPLAPARPDPQAGNALYRNLGDWRFENVTNLVGVAGSSFGLGVTVGDCDNDGDPDLFVNNAGPDALYRNNGDGTFSETSLVSSAGGRSVGAGANFLDFDADGDLDLFVANYVEVDPARDPRRTIDGHRVYPGPLDFDPAPGVLFENLGDGSFRDVSQSSGIGPSRGSGMGTLCLDYNQDGDTDVLVANDELGNFLFDNDGRGVFTEVGVARGFAFSSEGRPRGNMGLDCADFDGDERLDVISTTYSNEWPILYKSDGGAFEDVARRSGDLGKSLPHVKWGVGFGDFDCDGLADLFFACGDINREVHRWKPGTAFLRPNLLFRNFGNGTFGDISANCGTGLAPVESSRGAGLDDLDNDGDLDIVVLNSGSQSTIIRNDSIQANHWLQLELRGTSASRDAVGAHIRLAAGGRTLVAQVHSGRGYQSHFGSRLHFGLGASVRAERIEIRWLGGGQDVLSDVPANQRLCVIQGSSSAISQRP